MKRKHFVPCWGLLLALLVAQLCAAQSVTPTITFLLHSGRPNATAPLTDVQVNAIASLLQNLQTASDPEWSNLGWRGFQIDNPGGSGPLPLRVVVFDCIIKITTSDGLSSFYQDTNGNLFAYLVRNSYIGGAPPLPADTYIPSCSDPQHAMPKLATEVTPGVSPWPTNGSEPAYNPAKWNAAAVIADNNCYNYSTNIQTDTFAQPGKKAGKIYQEYVEGGVTKLSCKDVTVDKVTYRGVQTAAEADGLAPQVCTKACPDKTFKVALVVDPIGKVGKGLDPDFHWYQQNDTIDGNKGYFSHKPGETEAVSKDTSKALIPTPDKADRRAEGTDGNLYPGYTDFCACYCVDPTKVTIK